MAFMINTWLSLHQQQLLCYEFSITIRGTDVHQNPQPGYKVSCKIPSESDSHLRILIGQWGNFLCQYATPYLEPESWVSNTTCKFKQLLSSTLRRAYCCRLLWESSKFLPAYDSFCNAGMMPPTACTSQCVYIGMC